MHPQSIRRIPVQPNADFTRSQSYSRSSISAAAEQAAVVSNQRVTYSKTIFRGLLTFQGSVHRVQQAVVRLRVNRSSRSSRWRQSRQLCRESLASFAAAEEASDAYSFGSSVEKWLLLFFQAATLYDDDHGASVETVFVVFRSSSSSSTSR